MLSFSFLRNISTLAEENTDDNISVDSGTGSQVEQSNVGVHSQVFVSSLGRHQPQDGHGSKTERVGSWSEIYQEANFR